MKILFLTVLSCMLLGGCSINSAMKENTKTNEAEITYPVSSYINHHKEMQEMAENGGVGTAEIEMKTMEDWAEEADYIILGSIISLDRAETVLGENMQSALGFTIGKLLVQESYKGDSLNGEVLQYLKNGGVISMAQYDVASLPEEVQKRERIREETGNDADTSKIYLNTTLEQDIKLEEGKTYLLALRYVDELDSYLMTGFNTMSREVDISKVDKVKRLDIDTTNTQVKNYITGKFEPLGDVLAEMKIKD